MSKLIILEGARGTGKSTISFKLRQQIKHSTLINFTGFHDDGEKGLRKISNYYQNWFTFFRNLRVNIEDYIIICDRFFPSEMVFSSLYKDYDFTSEYKMLCKLLPTLAEEIILLNFSINNEKQLKERLIRDKIPFSNVDESVAETLKQQDEYERAIKQLRDEIKWDKDSSVKIFNIDTTSKSINEIEKEVKSLL
ncbi:hypothetical protein CHH83_01850 [Bacillus sp. 7586-K]|nr:hypothetical protein CHH83_01850 [Bacillus sp. 7586-K]